MKPNLPSMIKSGRQIRAARALLGMPQEELAREVGTTVRTVRAWEARERPPSAAPVFAGKVEDVLTRRGIVFLDNPAIGVALRDQRT